MRSSSTVDRPAEEPLRFQGPTIEAAVGAARAALGSKVRILEANRIRRGGIGGFFATDLGVEVAVLPDGESMEAALHRLVEQTTARDGRADRPATVDAPPAERDSFAGALAREMTAATADIEDLPPVRPRRPANVVVVEPPMSPADSFGVDPVVVLDRPEVARAQANHAPEHQVRQSAPIVEDDITITAEDILAELAELTELTAMTALTDVGELADVAKRAPAQPPTPGTPAVHRPRRIHRAGDRRRTTPSLAVEQLPVVESLRAVESLPVDDPLPVVDAEPPSPEPRPTSAVADLEPAAKRNRRTPVGRQVELAVSAAGQLVRTVADGVSGAPTITVKVVVTTADGSQVEAEAQLGGTQ